MPGREPMTEEEFHARYPGVVAMSLLGARWVGSALTRSRYIYWDATASCYGTAPR